jgi:glycosyltransferase involved in cell wall biosynthesis
MKVLLAGYLLGQGGIQSHMKWLAKSLGEEGVEVLAISLGGIQCSSSETKDLEQFQSSNVRFIYLTPYENQKNNLGISKLQGLAEILSIIKEFAPDIYLAAGTGWNLFIPPLLTGTKIRKIFFELMSGEPCGWQDSRWIARWCFDEVVGQSPIVATTFANCFGWKKTILAIPAMPEPLEITASLPIVFPKKTPIGTAKAALFSRLVPHKQAFWLVQQWDLLKDLLGELHIHGSGPEEALIKEYIRLHGLADRVKCFGRYPEGQDYVDLISSYDLTLLPTIGAEGAPLVLLESMACGVPFVAYGVGGIPDYGVDNPNVSIVDPQSNLFIANVRKVLLQLSEDEIDQLELQDHYFKHYSYSVLKQSWLSYLSDS